MRTAALGIILGFMASAAWAGEVSLRVVETEYRTVDREAVLDAVIEAVNQSTVSAQTSGRVVELNFDVDDYVEKGAVLIRLRDTQQRAAVQGAEAQFEEAQAEFSRVEELFGRNLVSKSAFDKAQAALKAARANLAQAREQLDHTVVRAPYSGIMVERHVEVGETANPGQPLMTGLSLEQLRATANAPQVHIAAIRKLGVARVLLPGDRGSVPGRKLTISPYADPQTHTFNIRVDLPEGQHGVYPGMFAKAAFTVGREKQLLIPADAVVRRSEVTAVYVVGADGEVSFRQVRVGRRVNDGMVVVLAGLQAGESVAIEPIRAGVLLKEQRGGDRS